MGAFTGDVSTVPTFKELIDEQILRLNPLATVYVAVFQSVSRAVIGENDALIYVPWGPYGRTIFVAETPFTDDELGNRAPLGVRYFVASACPDHETAMRYLVYTASRLNSLFQLAVNAVALPLHLRLMTIWGDGLVPFRELLFEPEIAHPINSRVAAIPETQNLFSNGWRSGEQRIERAVVQYETAMRRLHDMEQPMALGHLYIGVEALTKALIRYECEKRGETEYELGRSLGLDTGVQHFAKELETQVRRQIIFQGDEVAYKSAKALSDGLEHGFASWEDLWSVPDDVLPKSATYLRESILKVLDMPPEVHSRLAAEPFARFVEAGPRLAYDSQARVAAIDLRAVDFRIAKVHRVMTSSAFDQQRGEYSYQYRLEP